MRLEHDTPRVELGKHITHRLADQRVIVHYEHLRQPQLQEGSIHLRVTPLYAHAPQFGLGLRSPDQSTGATFVSRRQSDMRSRRKNAQSCSNPAAHITEAKS